MISANTRIDKQTQTNPDIERMNNSKIAKFWFSKLKQI